MEGVREGGREYRKSAAVRDGDGMEGGNTGTREYGSTGGSATGGRKYWRGAG